MLLSTGALLLMVSTLGSNYGSRCFDDHASVRHAAYTNLGVTAFQVFFAAYIQWTLIKNIAGEVRDTPLRGRELAKQMWHIMLYDFVFCIYVPVSLFAVVFGIVQPSFAATCVSNGVPGGATAVLAGVFLTLQTVLSWAYLTCWGCLVSCFGVGEKAFDSIRGRSPVADPYAGTSSTATQLVPTPSAPPAAPVQPVMGRMGAVMGQPPPQVVQGVPVTGQPAFAAPVERY